MQTQPEPDLYDAPPQEEPAAPEGEDGMDKDEGQTALINKEVCPDCQPGDMLTFRVVRVHENEIEAAYEPDKEQDEPETEPEPAMADSESLMD